MMRLVALAALSVSLLAPMATEDRVSELSLKAAFLYKFTIFLDWPESSFAKANSPYVIGVLGNKDLAKSLEDTVAQREVRGRSFEIRSYSWVEDIEPDIHLLYFEPNAVEHGKIAHLVAQIKTRASNAFIVSEGEEAILHGAHLSFSMRNARLGFLINHDAATAANIRISSKLLRLATIIDGKGGNQQ